MRVNGVLWAAFLVVLAALAPTTGRAATASASISVSIIPVSAIQVVRGEKYEWDYCGSSYTWTLSTPVQPGDAIIGATLWEAPPGCDGGGPDVITLGSQQATIVQTIYPGDFGLDYCCPQATSFVLFNVSGSQSTFTISSNNRGQFRPPVGYLVEVSGLGGSASVDAFSGHYYHPAGTGSDALNSGSISPSQAGNFLYGFQLTTYANPGVLSAGTGWVAGPNSGCEPPNCQHPSQDEYILNYNSTNPIAATFGTTDGSGEWAIGIIAIKH